MPAAPFLILRCRGGGSEKVKEKVVGEEDAKVERSRRGKDAKVERSRRGKVP